MTSGNQEQSSGHVIIGEPSCHSSTDGFWWMLSFVPLKHPNKNSKMQFNPMKGILYS